LGLSHEALYTIHKGAILPLLFYGAPVWIEVLEKECNQTVYSGAQRRINIKIEKAFRRTSNEALCTLTGLTPIVIKAKEAAKLYIIKKSQVHEIDHDIQPKAWHHSADSESLNNKITRYTNIYRRQQEAARGRKWNRNIYPEQCSAPIKVYDTQQMLQQPS